MKFDLPFKFCALIPLLLISSCSHTSYVQAHDNVEGLEIENWLTLGPIAAPLPVYHDVKSIRNKTYGLDEALKFQHIDQKDWWPSEGDEIRWDNGRVLTWERRPSGSNGLSISSSSSGTEPEIIWAGSYVESSRWMPAKLEITGEHPFLVFINGDQVASKSEGNNDGSGHVSRDITLENGKHFVLIKTIKDPESDQPWNINAKITYDEAFQNSGLVATTSPRRHLNLKMITDEPVINNVSLSADGSLAAIGYNQASGPEGNSESWVELRNVNDGSIRQSFRGGLNVNGLQWAPDGFKFTYVERNSNGSSLWLVNMDDGTQKRLLRDVQDFGSYSWSPEGSFIIYSVSERQDRNNSGISKLDGMPDRRPGYRQRSFLYKLNLPSGTSRRLTSGLLTTGLNDISPDGQKLVFSRQIHDFSERPYSRIEMSILNLQTMQLDSLFSVPFGGSASWSPDGKHLLLTGGPSMFGELGTNVSGNKIANDYDTQAYLYSIDSKEVKPITFDFDPSIDQVRWSRNGDEIYMVTSERAFRTLWRYDLSNETFNKMDMGVDMLLQFNIAKNAPIAIYTGAGVADPPKAYVTNLENGNRTLFADPAEESYNNVSFGEIRDWNFENKNGAQIDGRVYYPPNFDSNKDYPVIVYYYGGTTPVTRSFGGRYPFDVYTAQGYLVYVLQPSGAIGYGQDFSALHVNDWGIIVADEIIDGVGQFLEAHSYANPDKVGAIGASFGGFMTMLLQTRTDMFAAAISHAGISNITSYWGEGFWGYQYSSVATAHSYPWNRPDIYVDQSPIYHADKITTPLLLLHGMSDTNVPPGESIQMYTALKLLNRDVAFVQIEDQDHHILDYKKRIVWTNTILAWFDKWLKDEGEWWDEKY